VEARQRHGEGLGWIGFDPTNDILVENDHIVLAVGRDFSDVSPVDGVIVGSALVRVLLDDPADLAGLGALTRALADGVRRRPA